MKGYANLLISIICIVILTTFMAAEGREIGNNQLARQHPILSDTNKPDVSKVEGPANVEKTKHAGEKGSGEVAVKQSVVAEKKAEAASNIADAMKAEKAIVEAKAKAVKLAKAAALKDAMAEGKTAIAKAELQEANRLKGGEVLTPEQPEGSIFASARPDFLKSVHGAPLPSVVHVVTHEANYGEFNPKLRPMCSKIVEEIEQSQVKNRESRSFGAFEAAIHTLGGFEERVPDLGDDKITNYCIEIIKSYVFGPQSLDWNYVASLRNCAVDKMGRTIFMKLVERGMVKSILNEGSKRLYGIPLHKLRDTDNNTCLHLAVISQNKFIVETILGRLGSDKIASMLDQRNIHGERPVDMAVRLRLADLEAVLRQHYSTFAPLAKMAIRRRHQSPENLTKTGKRAPSIRSQIIAEATGAGMAA